MKEICNGVSLLFLAIVAIWFIQYWSKTSEDRQNNKRVEQYRREFANRVREHGYSTDAQVRAAMEPADLESDEGDGDAVLMQNLTKKRR